MNMTTNYKITEGSQAVASVPKTYGAIVYRDATYTYAATSSGTILKKVTIASETDNLPIQAAIDYLTSIDAGASKGTLFIKSCGGTGSVHYVTKATLIVKPGVSVVCEEFSEGVWFYVSGDINFAELTGYSSWDGGWINVGGDGAFTNTVFLIDTLTSVTYGMANGIGESYAPAPHVKNCTIFKASAITDSGGKAIWLKCEQPGVAMQMIAGLEFENIVITGSFQYAIYMSTLGATQFLETIAWNKFNNIRMSEVYTGIYMYAPGAYYHIMHNWFTNIQLQSKTSVYYPLAGIVVAGHQNIFNEIDFMDWDGTRSGYTINLTSKSSDTVVRAHVELPDTILDNGLHNSIIVSPTHITSRPISLTVDKAIQPDTNGAVVAQTEMAGSAFPIPYGIFTVAGRETERLCWITYMEPNWDGSNQYTNSGSGFRSTKIPSYWDSEYTTDAGTDTTHIHDADVTRTVTDFYVGWLVVNVTRNISATVTGYTTGVITHGVIAGQTTGDKYYLQHPTNGRFTAQVDATFPVTAAADSVKWHLYATRIDREQLLTATPKLVATFSTGLDDKTAWSQIYCAPCAPFLVFGRGETILWEIKRDSDDGYAEDAYLLGVRLMYNIGTTAWQPE
jgi:hypothetical protein